MRTKQLLILGFIAVIATAFSGPSFAKDRVVFGGGPAGGTFQVVANAIQVYKPIKAAAGFKVQAQSSAGSVENLRKTNSGRQQMSVVYSGHVYLGRNGMMKNDTKKYEDVMAVAWLYGAPGQLVTRKGSGINSVKDLVGKKVGVGNAGSGAFANCELFFSHMGVWDKIERNAMGYNDAAQAFGNKQLDAFWLFTAFPSGAVIMAAQTNDIALVNLDADATASGFYEKYPYFAKLSVPANTYKGVDYDSPSFQDSALWVANSKVSADVVYEMLSLIYTDEGLAHMKEQKKTFKYMSIAKGPDGIVTPFHPGAEKFWKEKGVLK
jgi:TRAP transporter TAXI family solute receptor